MCRELDPCPPALLWRSWTAAPPGLENQAPGLGCWNVGWNVGWSFSYSCRELTIIICQKKGKIDRGWLIAGYFPMISSINHGWLVGCRWLPLLGGPTQDGAFHANHARALGQGALQTVGRFDHLNGLVDQRHHKQLRRWNDEATTNNKRFVVFYLIILYYNEINQINQINQR